MTSFPRPGEARPATIRPIIVNVDELLQWRRRRTDIVQSFDDARTLFHEFGHGLHGLLSDVTYPAISGTSVVRDFVELPSQLYEHWLTRPEVLAAVRAPCQDRQADAGGAAGGGSESRA